eukprot:2697971-Pyramimonas_sp.AAC.1
MMVSEGERGGRRGEMRFLREMSRENNNPPLDVGNKSARTVSTHRGVPQQKNTTELSVACLAENFA